MAWETNVIGGDLPRRASANVSALTWSGNPPQYASGGIPQFCVVTPDTGTGVAGDVILATATTVAPLGVAQDGPASGPGQSVRVRTIGESKVIAGGVIAVGDLVMVTTGGKVLVATAPGATNFFIVGRASSPAAADGDVITVQLMLGSTQYVNA
jgi:hypothetical protein